MFTKLINKKYFLPLVFILVIGLIFRTINFAQNFSFAHDQDLYSWIAKDILVNKHLRLVGQVTSVPGVFIGPFYYYLMAASYALSHMNPLSAIVPLTIIGLATIISFFWLGKTYYSEKVGLILAFIYSISCGAALFDRWSVPTEPTILWSVLFLFVILGMLKGNLKLMPLYAILLGFVYHIHIALLPILPLPILAYFLSTGSISEKFKKLKIKNILISLFLFAIISSPFWLFEFKHNFSQIQSIISASQTDLGNPTGIPKLLKVINASAIQIQQILVIGFDLKPVEMIWPIFLTITFYVLLKKKKINIQFLLMFLWIGLISLAQFTSKRIVSEYYFVNILPVIILILGLFIDLIWTKKVSNLLFFILGGFYLIINWNWLQDITTHNTESYSYRKQLVEYIKKDAASKNYPCIGINYVANFGTGVGFRYLFWYEGINIVKPGGNVPNYNIIIPSEISEKELSAKFGRFGVVLPKQNISVNKDWCNAKENQPDPLLGYTE
jgi:4-amino-4-deoxy-L-arabinose transferase-like glycosyltransferase